jgi:hypothetical protein
VVVGLLVRQKSRAEPVDFCGKCKEVGAVASLPPRFDR